MSVVPSPVLSVTELARELESLTSPDAEYWAFEDKAERDLVHGLLHYPAMMVPRLQRELMAACVQWDPSVQTVLDPFVGSGTVMTEAMLLGRGFTGLDINPLAVLACRAKSQFFDSESLRRDLRRLLAAVARDGSDEVTVDFVNRDKWFEPHVARGLSRLQRAIRRRPDIRMRRFWWVALAETVRLTSNSRTSTVKLHLRPPAEIANRPDPVDRFREIANRNVLVLLAQEQLLMERQLLHGSQYTRDVNVRVGDVRTAPLGQSDLLMTSPPYGDNHTTVTYGQASFLPLQWIDLVDIDRSLSDQHLTSTHSLDTASLGGTRRGALFEAEAALDKSVALRRTMDRLKDQPRDRRVRVAAFFRDFDAALDPIVEALRPGGLMLWTVGDRSVGGQTVPLAAVLRQLLGDRVEMITVLQRRIPGASKRMPARNSVAPTMGSENILVLRKKVR